MKNNLLQWCGCCLALLLLAGGCATKEQAGEATVKQTHSSSVMTSYKGKIVGLSKRAQTLYIAIGSGANTQTVTVRFDNATKGVDEISEGHFVTIAYELRGGDAYATSVQHNKASLPEGVADIGTDELIRLIRERVSFVLVDPRPMDRYKQSHLPGAVSISVELSEQQQTELLPKDKNTLLVIYDGGHGRGTAINTAAAVKNKGFNNIRVYTAGRAAWLEASLPTYSSKDFIHKGNVILIDTRSRQTSAAGRVKGAYNLPLDMLKNELRELPRDAPHRVVWRQGNRSVGTGDR